ncbi:MAG: PD-(D/E)XK nuclease family transposase [Victivallales bacterium]|nr:PD-(D/E)XK nuclease family transposase [Victivallales bacterium]
MSEKKEARKIVSFDWAIKTILRDKANADVLEGLLSSLFKRDVTVVELLESEGNQYEAALKFNRVDVLARLDGGEEVIIEVQYESEVGFIKRLLYGTSKAIVDTLSLGESYSQVMKVYSVSIVHFNVGEGDDYVYHGRTEFKGIHTNHVLKLKDKLTVGRIAGDVPKTISGHDIMPEYFLIPLGCFKGVVKEDIDEWIYAIKTMEVPDSFHSKGIQALKKKLDVMSMELAEQRSYTRYMEAKGSDKGTLEDAHAEGLDTGREERQVEVDEAKREMKEAQRREEEARQREEALHQVALNALIAAGLSEEEAQKQLKV